MKVVRSQWSVVSNDIFAVSLSAVLFALCLPADAQQQAKIPKIGWLELVPVPSQVGGLSHSSESSLNSAMLRVRI